MHALYVMHFSWRTHIAPLRKNGYVPGKTHQGLFSIKKHRRNNQKFVVFPQIGRLQRFQAMVGKLRMRWIQCAYLPVDDYDHALCKLFERAELHDPAAEISYLQIEDPLCLSKECLASLSAKLAQLDQNFYTRQSRIKAMEHALGQIYQDLGKPIDKRIVFRNEGTVRYAAEVRYQLI